MIRVAPGLADLSKAFPSPVFDFDLRRRAGQLAKDDLDVSRVLGVGGDVPEIAQPARWLPLNDLAPLDLLAGRCALVDPPAGARLENDIRSRLVRHGVLDGPPRRSLASPRGKCVVLLTLHDK